MNDDIARTRTGLGMLLPGLSLRLKKLQCRSLWNNSVFEMNVICNVKWVPSNLNRKHYYLCNKYKNANAVSSANVSIASWPNGATELDARVLTAKCGLVYRASQWPQNEGGVINAFKALFNCGRLLGAWLKFRPQRPYSSSDRKNRIDEDQVTLWDKLLEVT